ncbi:hypothetical protein [Piscinibacter sp. XHJ-5]|uniref:hypothetical protein n=1 Tax=Piscinibacter sp. XHJ-5 TaxID=3037797 RepID=UPI002452AFB9|nr:hypothetical protein [Piscinibacter sp. XHJ-5]
MAWLKTMAAVRERCRRWWRDVPPSARDLRALAHDVEAQQPSLAAELRGIALHCEALQRSAR